MNDKVVCRETRESWHGSRKDRRVSWIVHSKTQSVEFWLQVGGSALPHLTREFRGEPCWVGGFEVHSRTGEGEPDQKECNVLGAPCWHDGSSLAASEFFDVWDRTDEAAFAQAAQWLE